MDDGGGSVGCWLPVPGGGGGGYELGAPGVPVMPYPVIGGALVGFVNWEEDEGGRGLGKRPGDGGFPGLAMEKGGEIFGTFPT